MISKQLASTHDSPAAGRQARRRTYPAGVHARTAGRSARSRYASRAAIALAPESADAHYNLGMALWYRGSKDEALKELRHSIDRDPAMGAAHAFLGTALRDRGDFAGAQASLQRAIALLPTSAAVFVDLGITYLRTGKLDEGDWTARSRAEPLSAVTAGTGLGQRDQCAPSGARQGPRSYHQERRTTSWASCWDEPAQRAPASPHSSGTPFACGPNTRRPTTTSVSFSSGRRRRSGHCGAARGNPHQPRLCGCAREPGRGADRTNAAEAVRELEKAVALAPGS